jgi:hypothetical protein
VRLSHQKLPPFLTGGATLLVRAAVEVCGLRPAPRFTLWTRWHPMLFGYVT